MTSMAPQRGQLSGARQAVQLSGARPRVPLSGTVVPCSQSARLA